MTTENKIVAGICLFFAVIIGFLFWKGPNLNQSSEAKNPELLVRADSHMTGKREAKVTMVEFGDYQCPACASVNTEIKKVLEVYKDNPDFNFVFRNFPLIQHKNAIMAAEAAESAGAQGKYFDMEAVLYDRQTEWAESGDPLAIFTGYAKTLALDIDRFGADMREHKFVDKIKADVLDAQLLGVSRTPTIYINGVEQRDFSFEALRTKIDELLAK